jgi:hypothetical protein
MTDVVEGSEGGQMVCDDDGFVLERLGIRTDELRSVETRNREVQGGSIQRWLTGARRCAKRRTRCPG